MKYDAHFDFSRSRNSPFESNLVWKHRWKIKKYFLILESHKGKKSCILKIFTSRGHLTPKWLLLTSKKLLAIVISRAMVSLLSILVRLLFNGFKHSIKRFLAMLWITGTPQGHFLYILKGIRKGDTLSPYLIFILCLEVLAISIGSNKQMQGILVDKEEIKFGIFADDLTMSLGN